MILDPNYVWPKWVGHVIGVVTYFMIAYGTAMGLAKEPLFSWTALVSGLTSAIAYTHGLYQVPPNK